MPRGARLPFRSTAPVFYFEACGEVEFDNESAQRYAAAGDELVLAERTRQAQEIRRIRRKLGLARPQPRY